MDLLEVRRVFNMRVKIIGLDGSDVSAGLKLWVFTYFGLTMFSGLIYSSSYLMMVAMFSIIPMIILVKFLKLGRTEGHLEYLELKIFKNREGKKKGIYSPYNLNKRNYIYKTKTFVRKPKV